MNVNKKLTMISLLICAILTIAHSHEGCESDQACHDDMDEMIDQ